MHRGDATFAVDSGANPHQDGMAPAVRVKDLLARQGAFDRPPGQHRELADDDLVRERVGLAAKAAAVRGPDHTNAVHRQLEHLGQRAMHVVDDLGRGPERHLAVHVSRDRAVLLHGQVRVALEEEDVFAGGFRTPESRVDVAELECHELVNVVRPAVILDPFVFGRPQRSVDRHDRLEHLVLDRDRIARHRRDLLLGGRHRGDRVADVAHLLVLQGALVLRHGKDAELDRQVRPRDHGKDAGYAAGGGGVDGHDARVGMRAAQDPAVQGARREHVVRVDGAAGDFAHGVDLRKRLAYYFHLIRSAASSIASRIFA